MDMIVVFLCLFIVREHQEVYTVLLDTYKIWVACFYQNSNIPQTLN